MRSVSFAWDLHPDATVTNYKVYAGRQSGVYTEPGFPQSMGIVTTGAVLVASGVKFYFAMSAVNPIGESGLSNEAVSDPALGVAHWLVPTGRG